VADLDELYRADRVTEHPGCSREQPDRALARFVGAFGSEDDGKTCDRDRTARPIVFAGTAAGSSELTHT